MHDSPRARREPARTSPSPVGVLALVIFFGLGAIGLLVGVNVVSAFERLDDDLPSPRDLANIGFQEESIVFDRNGTELARFGVEQREVIAFEDIPPLVIDAHTAIEDKTFWENAGFDPLAIVAAGIDSIRGNSRGASTITQQLVRQRLLPEELVQDPDRQIERKLKEIIQSIRLTNAFPGEPGKQQIIAAYLNQNYYGNQTYGIKAAAETYFGKPLEELTPAEAAILAGLPKSPSNYDLVRNAVVECEGGAEPAGEECPGESRLVVPDDTDIVRRRNQILDLLAEGDRTPLSGDQVSSAEFEAAKEDEVVLGPQTAPRWTAPHFVWAVQKELAEKVCGVDVPTCTKIEQGGLRITTTLDVELQAIAEKWVKAATLVPQSRNPQATADAIGVEYAEWMQALRGKNLHNGALVALDYQTGQLIAYVGSAEYYLASSRPELQPQYDVVGSGFRQPGSAFKPFNYLVGIDDRRMTAASMFMDTSVDFGGGYTPGDADNTERGPVRLRDALQFSLNIPSVKALAVNSIEHVFARAREFGMVFATEQTNAGLSLALGVQEVRPVDLVTAYGTLANGGNLVPHTTIIEVTDRQGEAVVPAAEPVPTPVASPQAAFVVTDILAGNTIPSVNPFWGEFELTNAAGEHRPATLKTGTNNDAKDLNAYGFIAAPSAEGRTAGEYALAVGVWNGNSDNTDVSTPEDPVFSIDVTTHVWQGFFDEATKDWSVNGFAAPDGLVQAQVDPWSGLLATSGGPAVTEWFLDGTAPTSSMPPNTCGSVALEYTGFEKNFESWMRANRDWFERARRGPGTVGGVNDDPTAYFYNGRFQPYGQSWGPFVEGRGCAAPSPSTTCIPGPTPDASGVVPSFELPTPDPSASQQVIVTLCPTPSPSPSPSASLEVTPSPTPEPSDTPRPTPPNRTPEPTPLPSVEPTPDPSAAVSPAAAISPQPSP